IKERRRIDRGIDWRNLKEKPFKIKIKVSRSDGVRACQPSYIGGYYIETQNAMSIIISESKSKTHLRNRYRNSIAMHDYDIEIGNAYPNADVDSISDIKAHMSIGQAQMLRSCVRVCI